MRRYLHSQESIGVCPTETVLQRTVHSLNVFIVCNGDHSLSLPNNIAHSTVVMDIHMHHFFLWLPGISVVDRCRSFLALQTKGSETPLGGTPQTRNPHLRAMRLQSDRVPEWPLPGVRHRDLPFNCGRVTPAGDSPGPPTQLSGQPSSAADGFTPPPSPAPAGSPWARI